MKYIRTKDNRIIDTTKYYIENSNLFKDGVYQEYKKELENAIKQADTIEKLCDEFVAIVSVCKAVFTNYALAKESCYLPPIIYGAIWTDKGLIYVAKMNDKGELELL